MVRLPSWLFLQGFFLFFPLRSASFVDACGSDGDDGRCLGFLASSRVDVALETYRAAGADIGFSNL